MTDEPFKFRSVTVLFFTSTSAPGMALVRIEIDPFLDKVLEMVRANGGPDERTALLAWDDIRLGHDGESDVYNYGFTEFTYRQLQKGWPVYQQLDAYEAASIYRYDAADSLVRAGVI